MKTTTPPVSTPQTSAQILSSAPLAARMRPASLDEFVGQGEVLGGRGALRAFMGTGQIPSMILWGPPGTGKTSLAVLCAHEIQAKLISLSAIEAGVDDVRKVIAEGKERQKNSEKTILFLDEIHRFNKRQQDVLLEAIEEGYLILIGATTEIPYSSINPALLSRLHLYKLSSLSSADLSTLIDRALHDARGLNNRVDLTPEAQERLLDLSDGDARRILEVLETAAVLAQMKADVDVFEEGAPTATGRPTIDLEILQNALQKTTLTYDASGALSALIKSIRGNSVDGALYWLATMLLSGEDPKVITRRLLISAGEDIGAGDARGLQIAAAVNVAAGEVGMPEIQFPLATAVTLLAGLPKSPRAGEAYFAIVAEIEAHGNKPVPAHLRASAKSYKHPHAAAPSGPKAFHVKQLYLPEELAKRKFYQPSEVGVEAQIANRLKLLDES
jgi:putative ATPase